MNEDRQGRGEFDRKETGSAGAAAPAGPGPADGGPGEQSLDDFDRELLQDEELEIRRMRMIKFLPNAITTASMFFGFFAIMMAVEGKFFFAVWAIVAAGICDMLDGRVARMTKSTSPFGVEYDSLSDLIAFGMAPAMIVYFWALKDFGKLGWAAAFLFVACAAIRLAKFNTLTAEAESRRYFRGIPSPAAAGLQIIMIMMHIEYNPELYPRSLSYEVIEGQVALGLWIRAGMLIWIVGIALLMVSDIRFRTFKDLNFKKYGPVVPLVVMAAAMAVFMSHPHQTLFAVGSTYLSIGLIEGGVLLRRRERGLREERKRLRRELRERRKLARKQAKLARREGKKNQTKPPVRLAGDK